MIFEYIFVFLLFSFVGWIIDFVYCSVRLRKFFNSAYFGSVPLCPIYGVGALIIIALIDLLNG